MGLSKIVVFYFLCVYVTAKTTDGVVVTSEWGQVRGFSEQVLGRDLNIFLGIPYAVPPVGDRRFKRAQLIEKWDGVKNATQFPNACYQVVDTMYDQFDGVNMWNPNTNMSEDCLYLNIWSPSSGAVGPTKAVMVWIYGGSFTSGSSALDVYDGRILAAQGDVIVVSMNYRMGALGFLYHGSEDVPGNMGVLDQSVALQWIYNNIAAFGGDNRRITVFGESAGSASASVHLLSPLSRDFLFGAALLSGTAHNSWVVDSKEVARKKSDQLAELVGCKTAGADPGQVLACLRNTHPAKLSAKTWYITDKSQLPTPLVLVVDGYFLTEHPDVTLASGNMKQVNLLLGSVKDEGTYFLLYDGRYIPYFPLQNPHLTRQEYRAVISEVIRSDSNSLVSLIDFEYSFTRTPRQQEYTDSNYYISIIDDIITDTAFVCPMLQYSDYYAQANSSVFMYYFTHRTSGNPWPEWAGVMHGYEIDHVFGLPLNDSLQQYNENEKLLSRHMIEYWTNFAKTG